MRETHGRRVGVVVREAEALVRPSGPSSVARRSKVPGQPRELALSRPLMAILAMLGAAVAFAGEAMFLRDRESFGLWQHPEIATVDFAVGLAYIFTGLVAWRRRPSNRVGLLMTAVGFAWFIGAWGNLSDLNVWRGVCGFVYDTSPKFDLFRVAYWFEALNQAILLHLILSFPTGRLGTRPARLVTAGAYLNVLILGFFRSVTLDVLGGLGPLFHLPSGHLGLWPGAYSHLYVGRVYEAIWILLLVAALVILLVRWHRATRPMRRVMTPVWFAGSVVAVSLVVSAPALLGSLTSWQVGACCTGALAPTTTPLVLIPEGLQAALFWIARTGQFLIPVAFLFGLLRVNLARIGVSDLVRRLGHPQPTDALQTVLARTLDDPSFVVAYWIPGSRSFVDAEGHPVLLPHDNPGRAVTMIGEGEHPFGALIHDPALAEQPILLDAVASAARLSMENERLAAEVKAQLEEVRASRARIVEATDIERRRIERDLHDGAQQRLVNLSFSLGLAQDRLATGDVSGASTLVHEAREDLRSALSELR